MAFTANSTESLNLVVSSLIRREDTVITTVTEHNSVLRPLYLKQCRLEFWDCDDDGVLRLDALKKLIGPETKYLVCTHGSNVTGNITDIYGAYDLCREHNVTLILDISQTFGLIPVHIDMADIFCFTGHKGLFGPQGTGGIITSGSFPFDIVKTGGSGTSSFDRHQSAEMPDVFEAGTLTATLVRLEKRRRIHPKNGHRRHPRPRDDADAAILRRRPGHPGHPVLRRLRRQLQAADCVAQY